METSEKGKRVILLLFGEVKNTLENKATDIGFVAPAFVW